MQRCKKITPQTFHYTYYWRYLYWSYFSITCGVVSLQQDKTTSSHNQLVSRVNTTNYLFPPVHMQCEWDKMFAECTCIHYKSVALLYVCYISTYFVMLIIFLFLDNLTYWYVLSDTRKNVHGSSNRTSTYIAMWQSLLDGQLKQKIACIYSNNK